MSPPNLASTLAHKGENEMADRLKKFMQTGSISTGVLLQVEQIVGDDSLDFGVLTSTSCRCSHNQNYEASKECMGPIAISLQLNQASQKLAKKNVKAAKSISITAKTLAEVRYKQKKKENKALLDEQDSTLKNLSRVRFDVAAQIGRNLIDDVLRSFADSR